MKGLLSGLHEQRIACGVPLYNYLFISTSSSLYACICPLQEHILVGFMHSSARGTSGTTVRLSVSY